MTLAALGLALLTAAGGLVVGSSERLAGTAIIGAADLVARVRGLAPLRLANLPEASVMTDALGNPIATFYTQDRTVVALRAISPNVIAALTSAEDRTFFTNPGVDARGIARALLNDLRGHLVQGGSTITQQLVKNALELETGRVAAYTVTRKLDEAAYAGALTHVLSKDQILTDYLNTVYFGEGAYGIEAAAQRYFSRPASTLSLDQAATLVALVRDPSGFDPILHPLDARLARNHILSAMVAAHHLTRAAARRDQRVPLGLVVSPLPPNGCGASRYPYFCSWVYDGLSALRVFGPTPAARRANLASGGYTITTTLNPSDQAAAQTAATSAVGLRDRVGTAIVMVQPGTGQVLAMAQNRVWGLHVAANETEVNFATSPSPIGSTMKAFTLAAALSRGLTPDYVLAGGSAYHSSTLANPPGGYFTNAEPSSTTNLTVTQATEGSVNTAFVQLEEKVGVLAIADVARSLGLPIATSGPTAPSPREGSFTLGARAFSPLDMASAYAAFGAGGIYCVSVGVVAVRLRDGNTVSVAPQCRRVLRASVAATVTTLLTDVVNYGTGTGAAVAGQRVAGKTGTTQNFGSAWFVGYTPALATASWMGDPRGTTYPLTNVAGVAQVYGGTLPAALFSRAMTTVLDAVPSGVTPTALLAGAPVLVPMVLGTSGATARDIVRTSGLAVAGGLPRYVTATQPAVGTAVTPGTAITLIGRR